MRVCMHAGTYVRTRIAAQRRRYNVARVIDCVNSNSVRRDEQKMRVVRAVYYVERSLVADRRPLRTRMYSDFTIGYPRGVVILY